MLIPGPLGSSIYNLNSGSGAGSPKGRMLSEEDLSGTEPPAAAFLGSRHGGASSHEETINLLMNAILPLSYDGRVSGLRYEDLVRGWITFTGL